MTTFRPRPPATFDRWPRVLYRLVKHQVQHGQPVSEKAWADVGRILRGEPIEVPDGSSKVVNVDPRTRRLMIELWLEVVGDAAELGEHARET